MLQRPNHYLSFNNDHELKYRTFTSRNWLSTGQQYLPVRKRRWFCHALRTIRHFNIDRNSVGALFKTSRCPRIYGLTRPTGRQGPSYQTTPIIITDIQTTYESELDEVFHAYPKTQVWRQSEGLLLLVESGLLTDLHQTALFLVAIPYAQRSIVRGWGFWVGSIYINWFGPRHTNFPDGSICAFEPSDKTWVKGDSIIELLDLYSLWAVRHLHLKTFGRWPGRQAVHFPYERVLEFRADEYCGCNNSDKLYGACCSAKDHSSSLVSNAIDFTIKCNDGIRQPPSAVVKLIHERKNPPLISDILPH